MQKRLLCEVSGRVQLVMYRDFTGRKAKQLGIVGTVENLNNGNVCVIAEGEEEALGVFLENLKNGPAFASVTNVEAEWLEAKGEFKDFNIIWYARR